MFSIEQTLRDIEDLRLKDKTVVTEEYQKKLKEIQEKAKISKEERDKLLIGVQQQETTYTLNKELVREANESLKALIEARKKATATLDENLVEETLKCIRVVRERGGETWELFCQLNVLDRAIKGREVKIVRYLLENGVDYKESSKERLSGCEVALTISFSSKKSDADQSIYNVMCEHILKDVVLASESGDLYWFLDALNKIRARDAKTLLNTPIPNRNGMTPVIQLGKENCLQALICIDSKFQDGIDLTKKDESGKTIYDYASLGGHKELSLWLADKMKLPMTPLEKACQEDDVVVVNQLLTADIPMEELSRSFMLGIIHGSENSVRALIQKEHNLLCGDYAVMVARYGNVALINLCLENGLDLTAKDSLPLCILVIRKQEDLVRKLLKDKAIYLSIMKNKPKIEMVLKPARCWFSFDYLLTERGSYSLEHAKQQFERYGFSLELGARGRQIEIVMDSINSDIVDSEEKYQYQQLLMGELSVIKGAKAKFEMHHFNDEKNFPKRYQAIEIAITNIDKVEIADPKEQAYYRQLLTEAMTNLGASIKAANVRFEKYNFYEEGSLENRAQSIFLALERSAGIDDENEKWHYQGLLMKEIRVRSLLLYEETLALKRIQEKHESETKTQRNEFERMIAEMDRQGALFQTQMEEYATRAKECEERFKRINNLGSKYYS